MAREACADTNAKVEHDSNMNKSVSVRVSMCESVCVREREQESVCASVCVLDLRNC